MTGIFSSFSPLVKGFALMVLAVFFIQVMNTTAKSASDIMDPVEIVFYRAVFGLLCLCVWLAVTRRYDLLKTNRPLSHLGRGLIGSLSVASVFWAYSLMPMTECSALILTSGLITSLLSLVFLKEKVGRDRWIIVLVGLTGTCLVAQPTGANFNPQGVAVSLLAAFSTALVAVMLRSLGKTEHIFTTIFYFMLSGVVAFGGYMLWQGSLPPSALLLPLIGTGMAGLAQQILKTEAYRYADASFLSPVNYTALLWATLFGWLFFHEIPTLPVIAGAALIAGSNIVLLWREKLRYTRLGRATKDIDPVQE